MQRLEVSGAVRPLYWSLGVKGLNAMDGEWVEGGNGFPLHTIIHTDHRITLYLQNMESVNVKLVVCLVTTGLQSVNSLRLSVPDWPV